MKSVNGNGVSIGSSIGNAYVYQNKIDLETKSKIVFSSKRLSLIKKKEINVTDKRPTAKLPTRLKR